MEKKRGALERKRGRVGGPGMAPRTTFSMSSRELVYRGGALEREKGDPWKKRGGPWREKEGGLKVQELPLATCFSYLTGGSPPPYVRLEGWHYTLVCPLNLSGDH